MEKLRDNVALYRNPPDHAPVLCVDEKSRLQALERSQPVLPMGIGDVEGFTHDDCRHDTTMLFATLDSANGTVPSQRRTRRQHREFLSFLRHIERNVPENLDVHLVMDNLATHKHPGIRAWFTKHPRCHVTSRRPMPLAESGGALVWPACPARDRAGFFPKRAGANHPHRTLQSDRLAGMGLGTLLQARSNAGSTTRLNAPVQPATAPCRPRLPATRQLNR